MLQPLKVLFRQTSMTSVLATTQGPWMVFFVGTADGQLIKVSVHTAGLGEIKSESKTFGSVDLTPLTKTPPPPKKS